MRIQLSDHFSYHKLLRFVLPSVIMMVFTSIYSVVDGLFVSNFVGKTPFAALNLIYPFVMIIGGFGFMLGTGGTALVSKQLGAGKREEANRIFSMIIISTLLVGTFFAISGYLVTPQVAVGLKAGAAMLEDAIVYGRIVIIFLPVFMLQNVFQSFLIAAEKPKLGLYVTIASGVANMLLDALFIIVFQWGIAGAALATGIGQCIGGIFPLIYFSCPHNTSLLRFQKTRLAAKPLLNACGNGSSELMNNISGSLVAMFYNYKLMEYIGEDGVSAYGILVYIQFIFIAIFVGYAIGCAPIVAYHYGAENQGELKNLLRKSLTLMGGGGVLLSVLAYISAPIMSHIFVGYDPKLYALTVHAFHLFSGSFLFAGLNIYASAFFTALNNGGVSATISFMRTLIFQSLAVLLLTYILGVDGIWLANGLAEIFAFSFSLFLLLRYRHEYHYFD